ncbi:TrkH family potassium uptake protein [Dongia soli]|uniref:Trk system potassium uptake protein n=1 Tax=Dongia soli TaxID=600628 RepID=A0ABU5E9D7_9PROT|nr:TrkH family potassium uptake protein [Dongia soli]MDY0882215.1 TrkH family potassium uptake protein [Dongia soli]
MPSVISWPDLRWCCFSIGKLLMVLAVIMLVPLLIDGVMPYLSGDQVHEQNWRAFGAAALATAAIGGTMFLAFRTSQQRRFGLREGFLLTVLTWVIFCAFSALPLTLIDARLSYTDAFFEAMSGLTTTGATIMVGLDHESNGVLLWRSLLHWIGGVGIIVISVMILPELRVGGMQLFRAESSDKSDKIRPRAAEVTMEILSVYSLLTLLCAILLAFAGMPLFDAVCHAMGMLATGGFSTKDSSIAYFHNPAIEWVSIVFMFLGGTTFTLMAQAMWHRKFRPLLRDSQTHWYCLYLLGFTSVIALWQIVANGRDILGALRSSAFAVVSIGSTSGYVAEDYSSWGTLPVAAVLILFLLGGCTGSTAGAIKVFRLCVLGAFAKWQLRSLVHPHRVLLPTYNGRRLTDEIMRSVIGFVAFYLLAFAVLGIAVSAFNVDLITAFTSVAQALGNIGHGLGPIIGPSGNFSTLPDGAKWLLACAMLLGRLELLTVLVLFSPTFWRG